MSISVSAALSQPISPRDKVTDGDTVTDGGTVTDGDTFTADGLGVTVFPLSVFGVVLLAVGSKFTLSLLIQVR